MKNRNRASLILATAAVVAASCSKIEPITAPALSRGRADFSVVAALGTGLTAGFQSGGLVGRHQTHSYASLFAQQVGARPLDLPLIGGDGIPPLLEIQRLVPPPIEIDSIRSPRGNEPPPPTTAYHNLGIPGARLEDLIEATRYDTTRYQNIYRDFQFTRYEDIRYFTMIQGGQGSIARQIATRLTPPPTFLLLEYGSSELLSPALQGTTAGLLSVPTFAQSFTHALDTLAALLPGAKMAVVNVPDVTALPFFTALSNKQLDAAGRPVLDASGRPKFLLGPNFSNNSYQPLTANDLVLLSARPQLELGFGYPFGTSSYVSGVAVPGNGIGLSDALVLSSSEATTVQDRALKFNSVIDTSATGRERRGAGPDFAVVNLHDLLGTAKTPGIEIRGVLYTTAFVSGGLISLDGVNLDDLAHALLCNELIRAVNARFGSNIQPVDPLRFATLTSSRASGSRQEGGPSRSLR